MYIFAIKPLRKSRNISLYELSNLTGVSRTYLRNLENNKAFNPTLVILDKIAKALNVTIKDLFYYEHDIDELKEKMNAKIEIYGTLSKEVLEISQVIDLLINIKMNKD